jgi:DHA2 family multidrug resistance protein
MTSSEHKPLSGMDLVIAAIILSLANFMVVLDTTIANVAMPTISGSMGVSPSQGTWIITSYAVAEAIPIPLTGWLVRQVGEVRLFMICVVAFVLFSVCCGLSWSLESLVFFRVLQGLAGGPLIPLSSTLMLAVFPKNKSNIALSLWGMMTVVAPIFGPILGGIISDNWHWGWVFHINFGFGILVMLGAMKVLRGRDEPTERSRIDGIGLALLGVFVTSFQIMIDKGRELDWFASPLVVTCAIVAAVSLIYLIIWELTDSDPVIDLSVFRSRNWLVSSITLSLMFRHLFRQHRADASVAPATDGLHGDMGRFATAPMGILAVATSPIVGRLLPKVDPRWIVTYGMGILAVSFFMRRI